MRDTKEVTTGVVTTISDSDLVMVAGSGGWKPIAFADLMNAVRGGISVGGRNLLKNSDVQKKGNSYPCATYAFGKEKPIEGEEYTVTLWGDFSDAKEVVTGWNSSGSVKCVDLIKIANGLYRGTCKWRINGAANTGLYIFQGKNAQGANGNVSVSKIKMEKGNVATDWTPAPEDIASGNWVWGGVNQRFTISYNLPSDECEKGGAHEPSNQRVDRFAQGCSDSFLAFGTLESLCEFIGATSESESTQGNKHRGSYRRYSRGLACDNIFEILPVEDSSKYGGADFIRSIVTHNIQKESGSNFQSVWNSSGFIGIQYNRCSVCCVKTLDGFGIAKRKEVAYAD